jgi:DNA-binding transcriptional LysR family regulator
MEIRDIIYVLEVAKTKNFSQAAQNLFITQPSLSQSIRNFEESLCISLFDRSTKPLTLTYAGEQFVAKAQDILLLSQELKIKMNDIVGLKVERITFGCIAFRGRFFYPEVLPRFVEKYPGIDIVIKEEDTTAILEKKLLKGEFDCCIQLLPIQNKNISYEVFSVEKTGLLMSPHQAERLLSKTTQSLNSPYPEISLADLKDEKFILQALPAAGRLYADMVFKTGNFIPKIAAESDSLDIVYALASSGIGLAFISDALLPIISSKYHAVFFTLKIQSPLIAEFAFTYRTNSYLSKATLAFLEVIKEVYKN